MSGFGTFSHLLLLFIFPSLIISAASYDIICASVEENWAILTVELEKIKRKVDRKGVRFNGWDRLINLSRHVCHVHVWCRWGVVNGTEMQPLIEPGSKSMLVNVTRRRLGSFRICALCTCCGGPKGICMLSPCCYAINCNIPNRPFGFCAFTPKTCNCFGCHL